MIKVKSTREGLVGQRTASGYIIDRYVPFVALPSERACAERRAVRVQNGDYKVMAIVLDVGPWNVDDDEYVFNGARPQAETGTDKRGRTTNGAGIDLGERVWTALHMTDNSDVEWEFIDA